MLGDGAFNLIVNRGIDRVMKSSHNGLFSLEVWFGDLCHVHSLLRRI